jgi:membrane protease YdiL (CAAX protease family)
VNQSANASVGATPYWIVLLPSFIGILSIWLLPLKSKLQKPEVKKQQSIVKDLLILGSCALAFPLLIAVTDQSQSVWYILLKALVLIIIPALLISRIHKAIRIDQPKVHWRYWAPLVLIFIWTCLSFVAPWIPAFTYSWPEDVIYLIVASLLTALTAGVGEELFYRRWLQTRLEATIGAWAGISLASLAFALMHLGGDRQGSGLLVEIASAIVVQGSFGVMLGYAWMKYRNFLAIVTIHILANAYPVIVHLLTH